MCSASGDIGFPTPAMSSSFLTGLAVFTEHRPRLTFVNRFILLALRAPTECFRPIARQSLVSLQRLPWGCLPLFATSSGGVVTTGFPGPVAFRPRRFSRPRRFDPPPALWVCFTPQPRPGFTVQGLSLSHSRATSSVSRALTPLTRHHYWQLPTSAMIPSPVLRAFFRARIRCCKRWGLATARARSPLRFLLLQVFALSTARTPSRPSPLMIFVKGPSSRPLH
jgi:hypothetical protein